MRAARAEFLDDMDTFPLKIVNSPKTDQFLIVHYHNYILYAKYNIYQKEKTSGTRLYFLLIKLIMVIELSGVQFGQ